MQIVCKTKSSRAYANCLVGNFRMVSTKFQPALVLGAGYTTKYQVDPIYKVHWFHFLFELHSKMKAQMINVGFGDTRTQLWIWICGNRKVDVIRGSFSTMV